MASELILGDILNRDEENCLRERRVELVSRICGATAAERRFMDAARRVALEVQRPEDALHKLASDYGFSKDKARRLLILTWENIVLNVLERGLASVRDEETIYHYLDEFELTPQQVNANGVYTSLLKAVAIRKVSDGITIPGRELETVQMSFNLGDYEKLFWVVDGAQYAKTITPLERHDSSRDLRYCSPSSLRGRAIDCHENVWVDPGRLGFTDKHIFFHGTANNLRIRYERIVMLDPYEDGLGFRLNSQEEKQQGFVTGDGWFAYNLIAKLAQL